MSMFKLDSEAALVKSFRTRDRKGLELPAGLTFPLFVRDYLTWTDPSGFHVNVVFAVDSKGAAPTGISFRRSGGSDPAIAMMCDWCHSTATGDRVGLLTADLTPKRHLGIHACLDLSCREKILDAANRGGKSPVEAVKQLLERMGRFAAEGLKVDLAGNDRD